MAEAVVMDANSKATEKSTKPKDRDRDFLNHLEVYLAKRDGVDKLLKLSRYATKIILASSVIPDKITLNHRFKSFESSVGLSRKAFRLGKFVQDVNALRNSRWELNREILLSIVAYGGEGLYYFVEQFIWLSKSGLIDAKHTRWLQRISAWAEFVGYIGSISLKIRNLRKIGEEEGCIASMMEISVVSGVSSTEDEEKIKKVREKKTMKALSILQDLADALMAVADIRDGKGRLSTPMVISLAGLLSAVISTHKNWVSC